MTAYREKIILTYRYLLSVHEELLTRIINVGMTGEYAEINNAFEPGDTFKFELKQFRGTKDVNLNKLITFFDELEKLMNSLANVNAITEENLEDEIL